MALVTLSPSTRDALRTLTIAIRVGRLRRGWTVAQLAERVGVSHATITSLEAGRPGVAVGTVLEAATLVGVPLFSSDEVQRSSHEALLRTELALLPATARQRKIDDDF